MPDKNTNKKNRREFIKATSIGAMSVPFFSTSIAAKTSSECNNCWQETETYESYFGHTIELGSGLEHNQSAFAESGNGGYWTHHMRLAGQGVAIEDGSTVSEISRQSMKFEPKESNTDINVFSSPSNRENAILPDPNGNNDGHWADIITGALSAAATAAGSTAGRYALSATAMAEGLMNEFSTFNDSETVEMEGSYTGLSGVEKCSHHGFVYIKHYVNSEDETESWGNVEFRSQVGSARNAWLVTFYSDYSNPSVLSTETDTNDLQFTDPREMTQREKDHFGVRRVNPSEDVLSTRTNNDGNRYMYVAENPPIEAIPLET